MKSLLKSASLVALVAMLAACGSERQETVHPQDQTVADQVKLPASMPTPGEIPGPTDAPAADDAADADANAADSNATASTTQANAQATTSSAPAAAVAAATPPPIFAVCGACHSTNAGEHGIGPSLAGIMGSKAGSQSGFSYSAAMKDSGLTWNEANLSRYLENPREVIPGTSMAYAGLKNAAQRQAVIDYLKSL